MLPTDSHFIEKTEIAEGVFPTRAERSDTDPELLGFSSQVLAGPLPPIYEAFALHMKKYRGIDPSLRQEARKQQHNKK